MTRRIQSLFLLMILCTSITPAWSITDEEIPEPLRPWKAWVLHGHESAACPFLYSQHQKKFCAWPESLKLSVDAEGVRFRQKWTVFAESEIQLPGDAKNWPVEVSANGRREPILNDKSGRPGIRVEAGNWEIEGHIPLTRRPEFLTIPATTALLEITVDERSVERPVVDANGRLWLGKRAVKPVQKGARNTQNVRVFRKLTDDIPLQMETRVQLNISGQERELTLGRLLLENFVPLALESPLPARIDSDGRLRVQVRPGNWIITLRARQSNRNDSFTTEAMDPDWPTGEIWSFEPRQNLRSVELSGPQGIDPQQTGMPQDWRKFPAYVMSAEDELVLKQKHRGDSAPAPDQLTLQRRMWLDFDGSGYTIEDRIKGVVNRDTRLSMQTGYDLGRVELNGRPEIVTTMEAGEPAGIEIRQGQVDLLAVSRLERAGGQGASGWDADFRSGSANLQLPPGWSLMSADGVDRAWPSWISRWNLWDIFIVLIVGAVFLRLYSPKIGLLAFVAVVIGYHEPKAPVLIWLNLAAVLALIALVPQSRVRRLLVIYRNLSFLTLALLLLPFAVDQLREALYPQLEKPWQVVNRQQAPQQVAATESRLRKEAGAMMEMAEAPVARSKQVLKGRASSYDAYRQAEMQDRVQQTYEPGAMIQTGPGQPTWQWNQVSLHWSGPVTRDQRMQLLLISPLVNRLINVASVILFFLLSAALAVRAFRHQGHWQVSVPEATKSTTALGLLVCMLVGAGLAPTPAMAETPRPELLKELEKRLLQAPRCLPACASISALDLQITAEELRAQLEIHVSAKVAVPLPVDRHSWQPEQVESIEDAVITSRNRRVTQPETPVLSRNASGQLQVVLEPGLHRLSMRGPVGDLDAITLRFMLRPHHVRVIATDWTYSGIADGALLADAVEFQRERVKKVEKEVVEREELLPDPIPVFLAVERTLNFGVEWHVNTTVRRLAPPNGPINYRIPLLAGESVTTPGIKVQDGEVLLAFAGRQRAVSWYSVLKPEARFELKAPETDAWVETWKIVADTRWHLETSGLAPVKAAGARLPMPQWRPWPGESLQVEVQKPTPVPGPTMTVEGVELEHTPGQRDSASKLSLRLRSSQGGDYKFALPSGARLQKLSIDGKEQILPQQRDEVRIPLRPGEQRAVVEWRNPEAAGLRTSSPVINLGRPMRNIDLKLQIPGDRWLLFTGGPEIGPAVMYWGVLVVVILVAIGLGRIGGTPLKTWHWLLLGAGMLTVDTIIASIFVVAWFFLMARRKQLSAPIKLEYFNLMQFGLAALSIMALAALGSSIPAGLLGQPDMQIVGNGSGGHLLRWYQDYSTNEVPVGWVISVPIWTYRVAMLLWSLWLAFALLEWIRWGWSCFSANGIWRKRSNIELKPQEVSVQAVSPKTQKPKTQIAKQEPKRDPGKDQPDPEDPWTEE